MTTYDQEKKEERNHDLMCFYVTVDIKNMLHGIKNNLPNIWTKQDIINRIEEIYKEHKIKLYGEN